MKKKVVIISDKVAFYMRFSTEEQANTFKENYLILRESEARNLFEELKQLLFKNEKDTKFIERRSR